MKQSEEVGQFSSRWSAAFLQEKRQVYFQKVKGIEQRT